MEDNEKYVFHEYYKLFNGMTKAESCEFQLEQWVQGNSYHNPVREECCPDFSCCNHEALLPYTVRKSFADAYHSKDDAKIMEYTLNCLTTMIKKNMCVNDIIEKDVDDAGNN